jgi:hypothetical protein
MIVLFAATWTVDSEMAGSLVEVRQHILIVMNSIRLPIASLDIAELITCSLASCHHSYRDKRSLCSE